MKKSTLIVLTIAVALGAFVYFYDRKHAPKTPSEEASWKAAFRVKAADIKGLTLENKSNAKKVVFTRQGKIWEVTAPLHTRADQTSLSQIVEDLGSAKLRRSFPATESLSKYGLDPPVETIGFALQDGQTHRLEMGDKDFSNTLVYARVDGSKSIGLLPVSLLDETDKPLSQLRDRSVLDLNGVEVTNLTLKNPSGTVELEKSGDQWKILKPRKVAADSDTVDSLLSALTSATFTQVASESPVDLAPYGLNHPAIDLVVQGRNGQQFHLIAAQKGKQDDFARDLSRPMVFKIEPSLYASLGKKFFDLRDKAIVHFDASKLASVRVINPKGAIQCAQGKDDSWTILEPVSEKGKTIQSWKIFDPLQNARATAIFDRPSEAQLRRLAKPAIEVVMKDQSGETTRVSISAATGKFVLARTPASPAVYQLHSQILKDLGFPVAKLLD